MFPCSLANALCSHQHRDGSNDSPSQLQLQLVAELTRIGLAAQPASQPGFVLLPLTSERQAVDFLRSVPAGVDYAELLKRANAYRREHPDPHPISPGHPSAWRLATALARRLDAVVPARFRVTASAESIDLVDGTEMWHASGACSIVEDDDDRTVLERANTAAWSVLSGVQDAVMHATREPWPVDAGGTLALPESGIALASVTLAFGDLQQPLIVLPPIPLEEFMEPHG